jgi:hypothetical protein
MEDRPVRHRQRRHRRRRGAGDQPTQQLRFQLPLRQRPTQARRRRPLEVIAHRAGGQPATAGDLPNRQLVLMFEPQDLVNVTHG